MKGSITLLTYLNRFIIVAILSLVGLGFLLDNYNLLIISLFSTVVLGIYQVIASLILLFNWSSFSKKIKNSLFVYYGFIAMYPLLYYWADNYTASLHTYNEEVPLIAIPVFLTLLITVILEVLHTKNKA